MLRTMRGTEDAVAVAAEHLRAAAQQKHSDGGEE